MEPKSQPAPYLLLLVSLTASWLQVWTLRTTAHPEVTIEPERLNGMVGEAVLLPVTVVTVPGEGRLSWKAMRKPPVKVAEMNLWKNRTVIYEGTGFEGRIHLFPNFTLQIQNLTTRDKGKYKVTLSFQAFEPEASVQLDVYEPIRGTAVTITSVETINQTCVVRLNCSTVERTAVSFSWSLSEAGVLVTENGSSLEVTVNPSSVPPAVVCTARNPVSWQNSSVDLDTVCQTNNTELSRLASGNLTVSFVSCGLVFLFLIAAAYVCWNQRSRSARWEDLTSDSTVNRQSAEPEQTHTKYRQQVVVQRSDSVAPSDPASMAHHPWQLGPEECEYSELELPTKTPLPVLETMV